MLLTLSTTDETVVVKVSHPTERIIRSPATVGVGRFTVGAYTAVVLRGPAALIWGNTVVPGYGTLLSAWTDRNTNTHFASNPPNGQGYCGTVVNGTGSAWDGNSNPVTGYPCLDGIGRGMTTIPLNGKNFPNAGIAGCVPTTPVSSSCSAWPQQYLEPVYLWGNTLNGVNELGIQDNGATAQNRDVYIDNSSFDGKSGTGEGLLSARPPQCTAGPGGVYAQSPTGSYGVAYFATDANGGNGELYVCTATNTWTPIYQPFTYPHPLVSGNPPPPLPNPPTNLRVVSIAMIIDFISKKIIAFGIF